MRVLLVDDDYALRVALTKALVRKQIDVVDLGTGEAALEPLKSGMTESGAVDICVLDLRMPGMSGLEVLRRSVPRKIPVVVLTGHGTVPDAVEAMRLGATNFVQKPVDADELLPVLHEALAKVGADIENADDADLPRAGERVTLEELEKTHIKQLLSELKNVSEVARIVGIDRRTLQRKMAAWGMRDTAAQ